MPWLPRSGGSRTAKCRACSLHIEPERGAARSSLFAWERSDKTALFGAAQSCHLGELFAASPAATHARTRLRLRPRLITVDLAVTVAPGEVVGIDIEPAQVGRAGVVAVERGVSNIRFETASVYELPYPDASFDAVFAQTLMEHLREPLRALREMKRVLSPGGVVGIADDDGATALWEPRTPPECRPVLWCRGHYADDAEPADQPALLRCAGA